MFVVGEADQVARRAGVVEVIGTKLTSPTQYAVRALTDVICWVKVEETPGQRVVLWREGSEFWVHEGFLREIVR